MKLTTKQRREIIKNKTVDFLSDCETAITPSTITSFLRLKYPNELWRIEDVAKVMLSIYDKGEISVILTEGDKVSEHEYYNYDAKLQIDTSLESLTQAWDEAEKEAGQPWVKSKEEYHFTFFGVNVKTPTPEVMIEHFSQLGINLYYSESKKEFIRVEEMHFEHLKNVIFKRLESILEHKSVISLLDLVETPLFKRLNEAWHS